jgi:hypothetical protein
MLRGFLSSGTAERSSSFFHYLELDGLVSVDGRAFKHVASFQSSIVCKTCALGPLCAVRVDARFFGVFMVVFPREAGAGAAKTRGLSASELALERQCVCSVPAALR